MCFQRRTRWCGTACCRAPATSSSASTLTRASSPPPPPWTESSSSASPSEVGKRRRLLNLGEIPPGGGAQAGSAEPAPAAFLTLFSFPRWPLRPVITPSLLSFFRMINHNIGAVNSVMNNSLKTQTLIAAEIRRGESGLRYEKNIKKHQFSLNADIFRGKENRPKVLSGCFWTS